MTTITFKENCRIKEWSAPLHWIFSCLIELVKDADTLPSEIVVTSINDSTHKTGSRHYTDEAIDIRSHNFATHSEKMDFLIMLRSMLNSNMRDPAKFMVILESEGTPNEHFHAQVVRGQTFNGV